MKPDLTDEERDWRDRYNVIFGFQMKWFLVEVLVVLALFVLIVGISAMVA